MLRSVFAPSPMNATRSWKPSHFHRRAGGVGDKAASASDRALISCCSFSDSSRQAPSTAALCNTPASPSLSPCSASVLLTYEAFAAEIYHPSGVATRVSLICPKAALLQPTDRASKYRQRGPSLTYPNYFTAHTGHMLEEER